MPDATDNSQKHQHLGPLVDSHAHLDSPEFNGEIHDVVERARAAGLVAVINAGSRPDGNGAVVELAQSLSASGDGPKVFAAVGFHPHHAGEVTEKHWREIRELARSPAVVALGEFGLDYYYENSPRDAQKDVFGRAVALARETNLPMIIHSRDAAEDTLAILDATCADGNYPAGVFHCFTGSGDFAREVLERGFFVGFTGIITFPKAAGVREAAGQVPLERLLVETDAPFCTPVPLRGKRNEPAYVAHVARKLAEMYGLPENDIRRITTQNAAKLFRLPISCDD